MLLNNSSYWDWWPYILEVGNEQDKGDFIATFGVDSVAVSVFVVILVEFDMYYQQSVFSGNGVDTYTRYQIFW